MFLPPGFYPIKHFCSRLTTLPPHTQFPIGNSCSKNARTRPLCVLLSRPDKIAKEPLPCFVKIHSPHSWLCAFNVLKILKPYIDDRASCIPLDIKPLLSVPTTCTTAIPMLQELQNKLKSLDMSCPVLFLSATKSSPSTRHDFARAPLKSACSRPMNSAVMKKSSSPLHVPEIVTTYSNVSATRILPYKKLLPHALVYLSSYHSLTQIHQNKTAILQCLALCCSQKTKESSPWLLSCPSL